MICRDSKHDGGLSDGDGDGDGDGSSGDDGDGSDDDGEDDNNDDVCIDSAMSRYTSSYTKAVYVVRKKR